ncbi:MAG: threonine/serine dehydratase [Bacteroidota bacterium]
MKPNSVVNEIIKAEYRIRKYIYETPLEYSPYLSLLTGAEVFLKLENLQLTGSFKIRGAFNKLLSLEEDDCQKVPITSSTGNHALAFAHVMQKLGKSGIIILPKTTSKVKIEALSPYNINLEYFGEDCLEAEIHARNVATKINSSYISPYNDLQIIAGQGTIGIELEKQSEKLDMKVDAVFIPVGGGGLISGIASYLKMNFPQIEIVACQPKNSPVMYASLAASQIIEIESQPTISDGTAGGIEPNAITFDICKQVIDQFFLVEEDEIKQALKLLLEKHQWLVEGAAGLSLASLIKQAQHYKGKNVVLVLCGRRLGLNQLKELLQ